MTAGARLMELSRSMEYEAEAETYRSGIAGLSVEFMLAMLALGVPFTFLSIYLLAAVPEKLIPVVSWLLFLAQTAAVLVFLVYWRSVVVTLEGDAVVVRRPGRSALELRYAEHDFTPEVRRIRFNFIPVWTSRRLMAAGPDGAVAVALPNFGEAKFSRLFSALRRRCSDVERSSAPAPAFGFAVPRVRILKESAAFLAIVFSAFLAAALLLAALVRWGNPANYHNASIGGILSFFGVFFIFPPMLLFLRHLWRKSRLPERIALGSDCLTVDNIDFPWLEIRGIVMTPPSYRAALLATGRSLLIDSGVSRKRYYLGLRRSGIIVKTRFEEYEELCRALETAAASRGLSLTYAT